MNSKFQINLLTVILSACFFCFSKNLKSANSDSLKMSVALDSISSIYDDAGMSAYEVKEAFKDMHIQFEGDCKTYLEIEEKYFLANIFMDHNLDEFVWKYAQDIEIESRKINYKHGLSGAYSLYAYIHHLRGEHEEAIKYASQNLEFYSNKSTETDNLISALIMRSIVETDTASEINYLHQALSVAIQAKDTSAMNSVYGNIAFDFMQFRQLDSASIYVKKDFETAQILNTNKAYAYSYWLKGNLAVLQKNYDSAYTYFEKALAYKTDSTSNLSLVSLNMIIQLSQKKKDYKTALRLNKRKAYYEDKNNEHSKIELKQIFDEVAYLNEKKIEQHASIQLLEAEKFQFKLILILTGLMILTLVVFMIQQFRIKRLLVEKNKEISASEKEITQKNKELTDSIAYAKRIQSSLLPTNNKLASTLSEHFVLYRPKDIVSGDFYWLTTVEESVLFAVADCTGHGVPGALVSVVCYNSLNKSINELGSSKTADILNRTRELVIYEFEKSNESVSDGMDIALCALDKEGVLRFSGANSGLLILRNDDILEFKADKMPIGSFPVKSSFKEINIPLEDGDIIYLCSDGFSDQFGGEAGKKMKKSKFKSLLLSIKDMPMTDQQSFLNNALNQWKGQYEQVDDICVMGIKFKKGANQWLNA